MKASLILLASVLLMSTPLRAELATVTVGPRSSATTVSAEATLEAVRQATLAARVAGRIVDLAVDAGDRVGQGMIVARIDAAEAAAALAAAEAGVAQAEAALINARAQHERNRQLHERGFISAAALDQSRAALEAAQAQRRAAQAGRGQAEVVQGYNVLRAPLDGLVAQRHVEIGETAQPGQPLLTVYDPRAMRARVDLPQQRLAELGAAPLRARVEIADDGRWIDALQVIVLPAADARTHTLQVRVELPPDSAGLVPGMFARVHFLGADAARLSVPAQAILRRGELTGVYVADAGGGFALRQVRLGVAQADGTVEVLAGLRAGDEVALDPVAAGIAAAQTGRGR